MVTFIYGFILGFIICIIFALLIIKKMKMKFKENLEMKKYNLKHWELIANVAHEKDKIKKGNK